MNLDFIENQLANMPWQVVFVFALWSLAWKGYALWKAARFGQKYFFVAILVVNTIGILEIIYIAFFQKDRKT